ncbi:endonuclease/exonuclease/phosphatase family protein [Streptomyces roseifaciens]|uniref:endonuclease/exonuclease/phosphatase family protein n=1 Tax=Streptomyces roseifaciens TaxID=1488406 RepID=UPI001FE0E071|nr:endonuclease/exonuclease/phosphatase family protein [Streptomyces roseifaciens]
MVSWNREHNGIGRDGSDDRWHLGVDLLARLKAHVVLRQELTGAHRNGGRALWAEASRLGRRIPFLVGATPESPNRTGVFLDPALCEPAACYEHVTGMWHPVCNPVVRLDGTARPLSLASFHLCSHDPARRATEAKRLTTLGKPGMSAIIGGDTNSYPHRPDEADWLPDWSTISDRSHFEHRTITAADGQRVSDTIPDEILAGEHHGLPPVFVELGYYAATALEQPQALTATASLWRTDQGPRQRIDRIYATPDVAAALTRLEVIDTDEVREASDHAVVVADFSLAALRHALTTSAPHAA